MLKIDFFFQKILPGFIGDKRQSNETLKENIFWNIILIHENLIASYLLSLFVAFYFIKR